MSAPADRVSDHRTPERATNRTQNVLKFGELHLMFHWVGF
jgi:hypothetical protein